LAVDVEFAFAVDFVAGEFAGIFDEEGLAVKFAFHFEGDVAVLERAVRNFCLSELVGVTAGEFFAVLFEFEDGVAILSGEGPFPDARGVRIAAKSGESIA